MSDEGLPVEGLGMLKQLLGGAIDTVMQKFYQELDPEKAEKTANYYATFYNTLKKKTDMPDEVIFLLAVKHDMNLDELVETINKATKKLDVDA